MILNLDPDFRPIPKIQALDFEQFTFPGGEPHLKIQSKLEGIEEVTITHRIKSFNDFGLLLLAIDALKRSGVKSIRLFLPYFPAARQDRVMVPGEPLSLKVYTDILNHLQLEEVSIYDPHSDVAPALLNNCKRLSNLSFIKRIIPELPNDLLLIAPDSGAAKKINSLQVHLGPMEVLECGKTRDPKTGKLSGFRVPAANLQGRPGLIIDDICDGGRTFIGLAKVLKAKGAGSLFLAVSHGLFSQGLDELSTYFERIYTTDSFQTIASNPIIQTIKLAEIL